MCIRDSRWFNWDELADELVSYARDMGFTHLELLPVSEHPFDGSWGYQTLGLFAPTSRFGDAAGFRRFIDRAHEAGLGVLLDWVPAHFPTDVWGLAQFDGTHLYAVSYTHLDVYKRQPLPAPPVQAAPRPSRATS